MLDSILKSIKQFFESLSLTLEQIFKDICYYFLDSLMEMAIKALNKVAELMDFINFDEYYRHLPDEVYNAAGALGLGTALEMIIATMLLKLMLKILPGTKLGGK